MASKRSHPSPAYGIPSEEISATLGNSAKRPDVRPSPSMPARTESSQPPPLPAGTLVAVDVDADAPPQWAWPRRVNTFRSAKPAPKPGADPCGAEEDGPCTCNQDCVLA